MSSDASMQFFAPAPYASIFALTKKSNSLSKEYPHHDQVPESNQQHYLRNTGHALLQLRFLCIVLNGALTNVPILHPSDWLAHRVKGFQVFVKANDTTLHGDVLHPTGHLLFDLQQEFLERPLQFQVAYQVPMHLQHRSHLEVQLVDP